MTGDEAPRDWLGDAAGILSLSGDGGESVEPVQTLRDLLIAGPVARRAREIIGETGSRRRIDQWADLLKETAHHDVFILFAYHPGQVIAGYPPEPAAIQRWSTLVELYEAWSQLAAAGQYSIIDERSSGIAQAYFARTRWLLLSLPFRRGWEHRISELDLRRINGESSRILTMARQARDDWLAILAQIDDYPQLKRQIDTEAEAQAVISLEITRHRLAKANRELNPEPPAPQDLDDAGAAVTSYVITRLLLPRFAVGKTWQLVYGAASWPFRIAGGIAVLAGVATVALFTAGFACPENGLLGIAPAVAITLYAVIALASVRWPRSAWPWLMRQPASAAVALLALALAPPDWWHNSGHEQHVAVDAALLLAVVGIGYLYTQAGNQDVRGWRRAWRPLVVAVSGCLHSVLVAAIGLRYVLPEFAPHPTQPPDLSCWWHAAGCGPDTLPAWLLVLTAAAWSFAAGVFLQIIWDDQPVTAPLAHVSWRRGS